ncbi:ligase-associated DNA damage response exonuclease [Alteromonas sediminis]|uniref:Ligase-associated DNA damage response exonuclease n=1 Tax=Alteromonas sediminis TaxID=2259342 RepID=A0A3N5XXN6_9ALTE|nr:ligase-associated DNA damage response exonuclease [Alteromonas sediminis]RPJ65240.1 ligase-associated DNA damage response exonuclease [Alteromonas sediminis]
MHPKEWISVRDAGIYCHPADAYIDPLEPVSRAIITHGHADHARPGHHCVVSTKATLDIMRVRYGEEMAKDAVALKYGEDYQLGEDADPVKLTLYPAGHILGSAQVKLSYRGNSIIFAGDYKRRHDPTCEPFAVTPCDVFVTEATFALPVFTHPPLKDEIQKLLHSLDTFPERCHLVGVYALGKCQRVLYGLRQLGYSKPVYLHGALLNLCALYREYGHNFGELIPVSEVANKKSLAGEIVLAPPSALNDRWSRKLPNVRTAMASGWMQIRARSKQRQAELPLIISDHCDWPELLRTVKEVDAPEVWVTHGREEALIHQIEKMGIRAKALSLLGYEDTEETG